VQEQRKKLGLSQKELAQRIQREAIGPITQQYLNDIEHGRRNPPPPPVIELFAAALELPVTYLAFVARQFPPGIPRERIDPETFDREWQAFRKKLKPEHRETDS
jgi:transcriptional regulator with XRE-family HTH domain